MHECCSVHGGAGAKHPLRAAMYSTCDLDLGSEGWTKDLIAAGFDPNVPTVWIAEGLFMYLTEAAVTALLREARSVSAKRSRFLIMVCTLQAHLPSSCMHSCNAFHAHPCKHLESVNMGVCVLWQAFTSKDVVKWYQESATETTVAWVKELAVTFKSSFPLDPKPYVEERGWHAESVDLYPDLADKYAHGLPWTSAPGLLKNLGLKDNGGYDTNTAFIDAVPL